MIFNKDSKEKLYENRIKELEREVRMWMDKYELSEKPRKEYEQLNKELKEQINAYKELSKKISVLIKEYEKFVENFK